MAENPWGNGSGSNGSGGNGSGPNGRGKEWDLLEKIALSSVQEQRRARRWGIFFKLLTFAYLFLVIALMFGGRSEGTANFTGAHTAEVDVSGEIADDKDANADTIISGLEAAFKAKDSKAVILRINSPGGSPVQSAYVYEKIRALRKQYPEKHLYAVITDIGASGAYYIASAADNIYVAPASLVGSIGVIMPNFGVQGLAQKLGVEDRTMTAGAHKAILSPFRDVTPEEKAHVQSLLDNIHQQFITAVKQGRGSRLKETPDTFSGLFWTGQQAVDMGLADGFGSVQSVAKDVVHADDVENYSKTGTGLEKALKKFGVIMGDEVATKLGAGSQVEVR